MDFNQMLPTLQSQASRIFNGDKDSMQDALAMAYMNYTNCLARKNRQLSIGELTNFIKYWATELNNSTRPHFGNLSKKRTKDVYYKKAYLNGQIEKLYFNCEDSDNDEIDRGSLEYRTRIPSNENDILFNIDFSKFQKQLNKREQDLLGWLVAGYNREEISKVMQLKYDDVNSHLKQIGFKFDEYFEY